ncbi:MAG: leucine-rich repeat domain-containing protein [Bacteroidales bacterium]|nr:leucine-rich repeat domain-containing protein [Candidatus Liminaster caballi]
MKKIFSLALILASAITAQAYDFSASSPTTAFFNITDATNKYVELTYDVKGHSSYSGYCNVSSETVKYNGVTYTVTGVSEYAFAGSSITSIYLPPTAKTIGQCAFKDCTGLRSINAGEGAWSNNMGGITAFSDSLFKGCTKLEDLSIYAGIKGLGRHTFDGCTNIRYVYVSNDNEYFSSNDQDNVLYNKALSRIYLYPAARRGEEYKAPASVVNVYNSAFNSCKYLKRVNLPGIVSVFPYGFCNCDSLESIEFGPQAQYIQALAITDNKALANLYFNGKTTIPYVNGAVSGSTQTVSYHIPMFYRQAYLDGTFDGSSCGWNNTNISANIIEESVADEDADKEINGGRVPLMYKLINYTSVYKQVGVTCNHKPYDTNLDIPSTVVINGETFDVIRICKRAFYNSTCEMIELPESISGLEEEAFYGCKGLRHLNDMPVGITGIPTNCFVNSPKLLELTLPAGVANISIGCFVGCTGLKEIKLNEANKSYKVIDGVLYNSTGKHIQCYPAGKRGEEFSVPDSVTRIRNFAFAGTRFLKHVKMGTDLGQVGPSAFAGCPNLEDVYFNDSIFRIDAKAFVDVPNLHDLYFTSKTSAPFIRGAFDTDNLPYLHIPYGSRQLYLTYVQPHLSYRMTCGWELLDQSYIIEDINDNGDMGNEVPLSYSILSSFAKTVQVIGNRGNRCSYTGDVVIPSHITIDGETYSVIRIGKYAFRDNTCTSISIPESVTRIEVGAFMNSQKLEDVSFLPSQLDYIQDSLFYGCPELRSITIPLNAQLGTYDEEENLFPSYATFANCPKLVEFVIESGNSSLSEADGVLFNRTKSQLLCYPGGKTDDVYEMPETVKMVRNSAFAGNKFLKRLIVNDACTTIYPFTFYDCDSLAYIHFGENFSLAQSPLFNGSIEDNKRVDFWFKNKTTVPNASGLFDIILGYVHVPLGLLNKYKDEGYSLGFDMANSISDFATDDADLYVTYEKGVSAPLIYKLESDADKTVSLRLNYTYNPYNYRESEGYHGDVVIPDHVTIDGVRYAVVSAQSSIYSKFENITLPSTFTTIASYAIEGSFSLPKSITFSEGTTEIASKAFSSCYALETVNLPASLTTIGDGIFYYTRKVKNINIAAGNPNFTSIDGVLYKKLSGGNLGIFCCPTGKIGSLVMPYNVTTIMRYAFSECTLDYVESPATTIDPNAFNGANIGKLNLTEDSNLTLSVSAFGEAGCSGRLEEVHLHADNVTSAYNAFDSYNVQKLFLFGRNKIKNSFYTGTTGTGGMRGNLKCKDLYVRYDRMGDYNSTDNEWALYNSRLIGIYGNYTFNDADDSEHIDEIYAINCDATLSFKNGNWRAAYLPFEIPFETLEENGIEVSELQYVEEKQDGEVEINFSRITSYVTPTFKPLIMRTESAMNKTITLKNVRILPSVNDSTYNYETSNYTVTFLGSSTGVPGKLMYDGGYYALGGGRLAKVSSPSVSLGPNRWCMNYTINNDSAPAPNFRIGYQDGEDGETTFIDVVFDNTDNASSFLNSSIYNINGTRVRDMQSPGLYVRNGHKVMVK